MKQTTTTKANGNGSNGHSTSNAQVMTALAALAAALQQQGAPAPEPAPAPAKRTRKPRAVAAPVRRAAPDPDHVHATHTILEAYIPDADHCASGRPGAGVILRVVCECGCIGDLEIPAEDAEIMAQTARWHDGEG